MDYAEARAAFFQPREGATAVAEQTPGRRLRSALEPIATIHYWSEPANDEYAALGLDFLTGYVWSRACVLGEADAGVVASAFGVFEPGMIATVYASARAACSLADVRRARESGAVAALRAACDDIDSGAEVGDVVAALRRGIGAADPTGRALFAGSAALEWPDDEVARLWHAANTLRELRGDSHLAACVAAGLTGLEANLLTEIQVGWAPQSYTATRGWPPEAMAAATEGLQARGLVASGGGLTDDGSRLRAGIEETTESLLAPALEAIGTDLDHVVTTTEGWSAQVIERGWFPPDPLKRASG